MGAVVSLNKARKPGSGIEPLMKLVEEDMSQVNALILDKAQSEVELIPELAGHLISSGGKRLRPMLTLAAAQMCGYKGRAHLKLAMSVEFMHTATLLHDDVVDESAKRRGHKTARMIWGNQASVLVGDYLLGQAFKTMVEVGSLKALEILSNAAAVIAEGEVMQLTTAQNMSTTEDDYIAVISAKTAALFSAAAEVGGVIADSPAEEQAALRCYGKNLGLAFQLIDDALDYSGVEADLGKSVGDDFREGKLTLPVVLSYRRGSPEERQFWIRTLEHGEIAEGDLQTAIGYMEQHGAIAATIERARHYGDMARDALAIFPETPHKAALLELIDFCISRSH